MASRIENYGLISNLRRSALILRRYLEAWTAIFSLGGFPTIAYVDGPAVARVARRVRARDCYALAIVTTSLPQNAAGT